MKRRFPTLAMLATLALGFGIANPGAAAAMGAAGTARAAIAAEAAPALAEQAQYRDRGRHWRGDRGWRGDRHWRGDRRHWNREWSPRRHYRPNAGIYFHFGTPAPRYYRAPPRRHYVLPRAHVSWCHARYRSYRAWDNTFQPYNGPRRQCHSPYA